MSNHDQVAHRWARNGQAGPDDQKRDLKGFNMFSEGRSIYSHGRHFEIARFLRLPDRAEPVVLYNRRTYSVSTSQHQAIVRSAVRGLTVLSVSALDASPGGYDGHHKENLAVYEREAADEYARALRARKYGPHHIERANSILSEARTYADLMHVEWTRPDLGDLAEKLATIDREQRAANAAAQARQAAERAERDREQRAADEFQFHYWRDGLPGYSCPWSYRTDPEGNAYMRRSPDGEWLETSMGASVPWPEALKLFGTLKRVHDGDPTARAMAERVGERRPPVGDFRVDSISPDGSFRAGCHTFAWGEVERLARKEGQL